MQAHRRMIAAGLFLISFVVLQFVKLNSCASYLESWLGFAPVYVVETAVAVGGAYFFMPKNPDLQDPILRVSESCFKLSCAVTSLAKILCQCMVWGQVWLLAAHISSCRKKPIQSVMSLLACKTQLSG